MALTPIPRPLKRSASTASLLTPPRTPPVTPKTRSSTRRALRDSPDNPFLATPENHVEGTSGSSSSANPSPHAPFQERPTIAYVFRGVRRECKNPLYNHAEDRPFSPPLESKLPVDHPDYSPDIHCIPKRLFVDARPKRKKPATSKSQKRARHCSPSFSADEGDIGEIRPLKLDFGLEKGAGAQTLDQELARPKRKKPATSKPKAPSRKKARQRSPSFSADGSDVGEIRPLTLDFGLEKRAGAQTLDQELRDAGESVF